MTENNDNKENGLVTKYDDKGNLIYSKNRLGCEIWSEYDDKGNIIHSKNSDGYEQWNEYDDKGDLVKFKTRHADGVGQTVWLKKPKGTNLMPFFTDLNNYVATLPSNWDLIEDEDDPGILHLVQKEYDEDEEDEDEDEDCIDYETDIEIEFQQTIIVEDREARIYTRGTVVNINQDGTSSFWNQSTGDATVDKILQDLAEIVKRHVDTFVGP